MYVFATTAQLPPEPEAGAEGTVTLRVRLPDGSASQRRFLAPDSLQPVYSWVQSLEGMPLWPPGSWVLGTTWPRKVWPDAEGTTLAEVVGAAGGGLHGAVRQVVLLVERR